MKNDKSSGASVPGGQGGNTASHPLDRYSAQPQQQEEQSPYFKSAAPIISLPKGGGALKGIDEKFSVNAINGTAGLEIGLPFTPGRSGFTPALSLSYNSGSGNSEFGLGWGLSLPSIQRKTDKKLPRYNDTGESDVFLLAGAEDLVPELDENGNRPEVLSGDYQITRYRPRIEGLFARIEYIREKEGVASWWRVTTKDNITTYYGLSAEGRIADPEQPRRIFKWLPQLVLDHKGNVQQYSYVPESTHSVITVDGNPVTVQTVPDAVYEKNRLNGTAAFANTYLKRVQYGNTDPYFIDAASVFQPVMPATEWLFEGVLDYGDHSASHTGSMPDQVWKARSDAFSGFHAGFEIRTYRRCERVLMFHRFRELNSGNPTLIRALELTYKNADANGTATETDYIVSAVQKGYQLKPGGTYASKALPAMEMDYTPFDWDTTIHALSQADFAGAPQGLTGPYQWTDFEGEGISGILTEQGNAWFYKNNLGDGHFATPKVIAEKPSFNGLANVLQWQDIEADGRRQVVASEPNGYWELDDNQEWQPFRTFANKLNIDLGSPFVKMLDLNGDGMPDILVTEDQAWNWYDNQGKEGFEQGGKSPLFSNEEKGPQLLLRDTVQSIFLADMNGDGLTDLVRIRNGEVCYWPNKGYGQFGAKVTMANAPLFHNPEQYNPLYLSLADISGTGAADLIYTGKNECTAWINYAGNAWSDAYAINPLPGTDAYSKIAVLDFLGNGTGCLVWSSPLPQHATAPLQYIDLMGGNKPYLMRGYRNGTGKEVSVTYKNSSKFYLEDKLAGKAWATRLPFPVQCIDTLTTTDLLSGARFTQSYRYRHGYYDHEEREFRGFGYVETLDTDSAIISENAALDQAPVQTRTWYHTGAWMREGTLLDRYREEYYHFDGWDDMAIIAAFPQGLTALETREAYRALKGSALRQEIYTLDGSPEQGIPYTVTATAYEVKKIQGRGNNRFAAFLNLQQQSVVFSCERSPEDTRIQHSLTLATDEYGNVLESATIAYPRKVIPGSLPQKVKEEQAKMHIVYTRNSMTLDAVDTLAHTGYRLRLPCEAISFEAKPFAAQLPVDKLWTIAELNVALGEATVIDFAEDLLEGQLRKLSHTQSLFLADDAVQVLPFGQLGSLALPYESYQLAFTAAIIANCYSDLDLDGNPILERVTGSMLDNNSPDDAGYQYREGGYWVPSGRAVYNNPEDCFYTPLAFTDPWENTTVVAYWSDYWLLPQQVTDALGNTGTVEAYDWRTLQPRRMQDANHNISEVLYDALGMPVAMAVMGKDDGTEGDTLAGLDPDSPADLAKQNLFLGGPDESLASELLQGATWRCLYDLDSLPLAVAMIARQQHHYPLVPPGQDSEKVIRFSYSDGLGRVLMHKAQVAPDAATPLVSRWVGSGRTVYNNKGNAVMQYEPYFSTTHLCDTAVQAALQGVSPRLYYDALNRNYRTELPDGTFTRTTWTAWEQSAWDNNDTVLESDWYIARIGGAMGSEEQVAAVKAAAHARTPTIMHTDTLARPFYTIQVLTLAPGGGWDETIHSQVNLDIQGNRISVRDGRGLVPLQYRYNMLQAPCYQESTDSGVQRNLPDAAGQPLDAWDAEDRRFAMEYDELRRIKEKWCGDQLLDITEYGETVTGAITKNLRGQVYRQYDASGRQSVPDGYDFKGNPVKTEQQLIADKTLTDPDWRPAYAPALDTEIFTVSMITDALGRPVSSTDPGSNITEYGYDKGGALQTVTLNSTPYVTQITYDAKGQRQAIYYGNNTKTRYTYDPLTYRLRQLLTTGNTGTVTLQDLHYYYDPVGNITEIGDGVQADVFFNNTVVTADLKYTYDALYRLVKAEGREQKNNAAFGSSDNSSDTAMQHSNPVKWDGAALQPYTQHYTYDEVGNILQLSHIADVGSYTRYYTYATGKNRLAHTTVDTVAGTPYTYNYDARGNMTEMPHLQQMNWNALNELAAITEGSTQAHYQYSAGQRIRKYVDKGSIKEERIYLGSFEIYRKFDAGSSLTVPLVERTTVHISDDTGRIAMLEERTIGSTADDHNTKASLTRFIYSNHLQSASLELDEDAAVISYEEYHPYGTTAYQANNSDINAIAKRYRYTGKERDEESGLYYHGARYYIPWLCRWTAVDPMQSEMPNWSSYCYGFCNPITYNDPSGMVPGDGNEPMVVEALGFSTFSSVPTNDNASVYQRPRGDDPPSMGPVTGPLAGYMNSLSLDQRLEMYYYASHYEPDVLMADIFGVGHMGPQSDVQSIVNSIQQEYSNAVFENIRGGIGGSAGYLIAGEEGSFSGARFDQAAQVFVALQQGKPRDLTKQRTVSKTEEVVYNKVDLVNTSSSMRSQSPNTGTNIEGYNNKGKFGTLAELDRISFTNKFIAEEKSAEGLNIINPRTGMPEQTPEKWANKQIFLGTSKKIDAIQSGEYTIPHKNEFGGNLHSLDMLKSIRDYRFIIDSNDPRVIKVVNDEMSNLSKIYPNWKFTAYFGKY